ncbi:MAG: hypothetical protein FWG38_10240 [Defluviitaleaceae bacterium]|nr:hypothetical protein [Defluviitaleaceae bacterium]
MDTPHILTATTVMDAVKAAIHKHIPDIDFPQNAGQPTKTMPLNIYTEYHDADDITGVFHSPTGTAHYPYVFIREDRHQTDRERFADGVERFHYAGFFYLTLYVAKDPFDRTKTPRLMQTLRTAELDLQRALKYLDLWGGKVEAFNNLPSRIDENDGVLHYFLRCDYHEDSVLPEHDKVERLLQEVNV